MATLRGKVPRHRGKVLRKALNLSRASSISVASKEVSRFAQDFFMITALFILDKKGDILISKLYKDGVKRNVAEIFRIQVINSVSRNGSTNEVRSPILTLGSTSFIYINTGKLWFVAVTRSNQDCTTILEFLYKLVTTLTSALGVNDVNDESIVNNFFTIYQLVDEMIQFGHPLSLETNYLQSVLPGVTLNEGSNGGGGGGTGVASRLSTLTRRRSTGSNHILGPSKNHQNVKVTWRDGDIKYRRNEIFLNVDEKINVLVNELSEILRAYVDGTINMNTRLSGMPQCKFGFSDDSLIINSYDNDDEENSTNFTNNSVVLEDCKFHQCVELAKFDNQRSIEFIPPDGQFQLMSYNCMLNINLPFKVSPRVVVRGGTTVQYEVVILSLFPSKLCATDVELMIPVPPGVVRHYTHSSQGRAKYRAEDTAIGWNFNKVFGASEHVLTAEVEVAPQSSGDVLSWSKPPMKLNFSIDMFSCSGLSVNYLRVYEGSNYRTVKWVKYCLKSGSYEVRY